MKTKDKKDFRKYLYWLDKDKFVKTRKTLIKDDYIIKGAMMSPCEVLKASDNKVFFASHKVWSRSCNRQGFWYRESERYGKYMIMSEERLPDIFDIYLDTIIYESDFIPERLPINKELQGLVNSECYQINKPDEWEGVGLRDRLSFKVVFTLKGFWKPGETLRDYWLTHRANHANFLCKHFTTEIEGENIPYSISENAGVCSSCVEFFNVISNNTGKLVRACPGSIMIGRMKKKVYYYVKPVYSNT